MSQRTENRGAAKCHETRSPMSQLFAPKSVAVLGASERAVHGGSVTSRLLESSYAGAVYLVNPKYESVHGRRCYRDLTELPEVPECVIIAIAAEAAVAALDTAGSLGCRAAVMLSAGFSETGVEGAERQRRLTDIARRHGMVLCGPNGLGLVNLTEGIPLCAGFTEVDTPGNVGIVAQSGSVAHAMVGTGRVHASVIVSSGNEAVTTATDFAEFLLGDPHTDVIALYIESVKDGSAFASMLQRARVVGKPVVVLKPGRSEAVERAVQAHTGALAGSDRVFDAVCRRHGALRVRDIEELLEVSALLSELGALKARRVRGPGLVSVSGGLNAVTLDVAADIGLDFPELSAATLERLVSVLPAFGSAGNPLDATGALAYATEEYLAVLEILAQDPAVGTMIVAHDIPESTGPEQVDHPTTIGSVQFATDHPDTPVMFLTHVGGDVNHAVSALLKDAGIPVLQGTRKGLRALQLVSDWAATATADATLRAARDAVPVVTHSGRRGMLDEAESKDLLRDAGLPVPVGRLCRTLDEAREAGRSIGYPVVLKIVSPDIPHKSSVGGVKVGVRDDDALRVAYDQMLEAVGANAPDVEIRGVLVEGMVDRGAELFVGMVRDPVFGEIHLMGLGGTDVEQRNSAVAIVPPATRQDVERLFRTVCPWLAPRDPASVDSIADFLARFGDLCGSLGDDVAAVDLNPVFFVPDTGTVVVGDALIEFGDGATLP